MVSDSKWFETLQCLPFYKLDKKPLQIYSDRVRVLRQEAKLLAEVCIENIAEVNIGNIAEVYIENIAEVYIGNIGEAYIGNGVIPNTARVIRSS